MKKTILYIAIVLFIAIVTVAGTYAYIFSTIESTNNAVSTDTSLIDIIYTGGNEISGILNLVSSKEEGKNTTVTIKLSEQSVDAEADMYIKINTIDADIATEALNWECHRTHNNQTNITSGTFNGKTNGDKIYIDTDYRLSTTDTYYTIYIWLDGNKIGNEALGAEFDAYIGAEAVHITELK